jgi:hypothetical protein
MPTNDVILAFLAQYGLGVTLLAAFAAAFVFLWKFWPKLVAFVNSVEVVRNLPTTPDGNQGRRSRRPGRTRRTQISALRESLDATVQRYDAMAPGQHGRRAQRAAPHGDRQPGGARGAARGDPGDTPRGEAERRGQHERLPLRGWRGKVDNLQKDGDADDEAEGPPDQITGMATTSPVAVTVTNHNP